jgi:hypothetical protein
VPTRFRLLPACTIATLLLATPCWLEAQDLKTALLAADQATSELSRDSGLTVALRNAMHPTAVLLWPGAPVVSGAAEVRRFLTVLPSRDSLGLVWQPLGVQLSRDSILGITWGVAVTTGQLTPSGPRIGRYMSVRRRDSGRWRIAAILFLGIPASTSALPPGLPLTREAAGPSGAAAAFIQADLAFAQLAGDSGAAVAFRRWAAPDALIFGGGGLLTRGPEAIGQAVAGPATWRWHPVAAGASQSGDLGWTVGEAVITPKGAQPDYSKYLTVWVRGPDRTVRFLNDGGNARPRAP